MKLSLHRPGILTLAVAFLGVLVVLIRISGSGGPAAEPSTSKPSDDGNSQATPAKQATAEGSGSESTDELSLSEDQKNYIWRIEHHNNVLSEYGWGPFKKALRASDAAALRRFFRPDFEARMEARPDRVRFDSAAVTAWRWKDSDAEDRTLDRSAFVEWLLDHRKAFPAEHVTIEIGARSLGPVEPGQLDGVWRGRFRLRIQGGGETKPRQVVIWLRMKLDRPTEERLGEAGWLRESRVEEVEKASAVRPLFKNVTTARGIQPKRYHDNMKDDAWMMHTGGIYATDYNRDGRPDMWVTEYRSERVTLYEGKPSGGFRRFAKIDYEFPNPTVTATVIDIDDDGWEDFALIGRGMAQVFRNQGGEAFQRVETNLGSLVRSVGKPARFPVVGAIPADYNRDGRTDLYVVRITNPEKGASWIEEHQAEASGNQLLRNVGGWEFEDVTEASGAGGGGRSSFTALWFDANNDRWPDLYVPNEYGDGLLLMNEGDGTFAKRYLTERLGEFGTMGVAGGDIDNDGHVDVYTANMYSKAGNRIMDNIPPDVYSKEVMAKLRRLVSGSRLYRNLGDGKFKRIGDRCEVRDVGWAFGPAFTDINNDGFLDIYATAGAMSRKRGKPDG